jgi:hypothetical protein
MSGPWHPTGRGKVSQTNPQALAVCDRCGFTYNHVDLAWQYDWAGIQLQNKRILVCDTCLDIPQPNGQKTIIIPPDPLPIMNPRPEAYGVEVPSFMGLVGSDESPAANALTLVDGEEITQEIRVTPNPSASPPYTYEDE